MMEEQAGYGKGKQGNVPGNINVKQAAAMAKAAGKFLLFEREGEHYFVTPNFMLHVNPKDAFQLRCKLNIEALCVWCEIKKGETVQGTNPVDTEKYYADYMGWILSAEAHGEPLAMTGLMIAEYNHFETQYLLAVGAGGYTALQKGQMEMVLAGGGMRRVGHYVVVDGQQVIGVMPDEVWRGTPYLVPIKKANTKTEAAHGDD